MWNLFSPRYWMDRIRAIKEQWLVGKRVMNLFEEIRKTLKTEIRLTSPKGDYLEAVITLQDLDLLHSLLKEYLGPPTKVSGREVALPREIQRLVDSLGGLRIEQSFFYKGKGSQVMYVAIWPWQSDPNKITIKSGVSEVSP